MERKFIFVKKLDTAQKRALRILYVWWVENFSKYMPRREFEKRFNASYDTDLEGVIKALRERNLVEVASKDGDWSALRITNEGVDFLRTSDVI